MRIREPRGKKRDWQIGDAKWAPDVISPDYRHLNEPIDHRIFGFSARHLSNLCLRNCFDPGDAKDKIIFGLRGCRLISKPDDFTDTIELREDIPDHVHNRCVLGVWDRSGNKLIGFQGSTVPDWTYMKQQVESDEQEPRICNLLPTGRYEYRVGTHISKAGNMRGALIQDYQVMVVRSNDDLMYTVYGAWDKHAAHDNIHAGRLGLKYSEFCSAGCQTAPGDYDAKTETPLKGHSWYKFREILGLDNEDPGNAADYQKTFIYMLFTGREARIASSEIDTRPLARLRFGSTGPAVKALQSRLGFSQDEVDGNMGPDTVEAFIKWQYAEEKKKENPASADGIVTPEAAESLHFDLIDLQVLR